MAAQLQSEIALFNHFAFAAQLSLAIVFLLSALPKLRRPFVFARSVAEYRILPSNVAHLLAYTLIPFEVFLAIAFLVGWLTDIALSLATVMLIIFMIAVGINLRRNRKVACGCFGNSSERISSRTMTRLLLLLVVVLLLLTFRSILGVPLPGLLALVSGAPIATIITYLLQTAFLTAFLMLLGVWILNLPELVFLAQPSRLNRSSSENALLNGGAEGE